MTSATKEKRLTDAERKRRRTLFRAMRTVQGERRVVYKCCNCQTLFGRRYIPYGLGRGMSIGLCVCQLTSRNVRSVEVGSYMS